MKKKSLALIAALLLLLLLTACGANAGGGSDSASQTAESVDWNTNGAAMDIDMPMEPSPEAGWNNSAEYEMPMETISGTVPANTKMILTGELELETKEFDSALQALDALVEELGGWYESRSFYQGGARRRIDATVRVPAGNFSVLIERAGDVAHRTYANDRKQDVSEAYYDSEARLTTQRTKLDRLQELLARAENMEDIIALESAISETELQIEYLTGALRKYDNLVDYATLELSLREVYRLSTDQEVPRSFSQRFGDALITGLERGVDNLEDFSIAVARNWLSLLIFAAVAAVIVLLIRRYSRKRRNRPLPPYPAPSVPPQPEQKTGEENENGKK